MTTENVQQPLENTQEQPQEMQQQATTPESVASENTTEIEPTESTESSENTEENKEDPHAQALAEANAKAEENWHLYLSAKAEAENIRKRAERDLANAHKFALEKFIPELLRVKDSLELGNKAAQDNLPADDENHPLKSFIEGNHMAINMFKDALEKVGVKAIHPLDEPFDPSQHQAMSMVESDKAPNTVIDVVQTGYALNERLLRPAMVIVAKKAE